MNVFDSFNTKIRDFVERPENGRLRRGTGVYSSPFRGTLYGRDRAAEVAPFVEREGVDVLWLGSNPNVPTSVQYILDDTGDDFPTFEEHQRSGLYAAPGWDAKAIGRGWAIYRLALQRGGADLDRTAFANFIPWGSSITRDFLGPLRDKHPNLLDRLVVFSDALNADITAALRPKLIIVPMSLSTSPALVRTGVAATRTIDRREHEAQVDGRRFRFSTGRLERGGSMWNAMFVPHPSSLRISPAARQTVIEVVGREIETILRTDGSATQLA